jgi:hypothetical protein
MRYQAVNVESAIAGELAAFRDLFDRRSSADNPKVGLIKLLPLQAGELRYAVAQRHGGNLWPTLWVRRTHKGEFFVFAPRNETNNLASCGVLTAAATSPPPGSSRRGPLGI